MNPTSRTSEPDRAGAFVPPTAFETLRAQGMFALAALYLLLVAGLIHRAQQPQITPAELQVMMVGVAVLWPIIVCESVIGILRRDRMQPLRSVLLRVVLVILVPPMRMGQTDPRTGMIWLPLLGWRSRGKELYAAIDRAFSGPMLMFAFLILPVLALEYFRAEQVRSNATLALALHIGVAVIWVAFAVEFILESSSAPRPMLYLKEKWLEVAIVLLPTLEFVLTRWVDMAPLARLLRLGRALSTEQLAGMQRVYRLRGVLMKAWQSFLILGGMGRLLGNLHERRLREVEGRIATLEEELAELRKEAEDLRSRVKS